MTEQGQHSWSDQKRSKEEFSSRKIREGRGLKFETRFQAGPLGPIRDREGVHGQDR